MGFVTGLFLGAVGGFFAGVFCAVASEADNKQRATDNEDTDDEEDVR